MFNNSDFWERVKTLLKQKKLTQNDLCINTNIKLQTLRNKISRDLIPTADEVVQISDFLNISCDYLLTGKDNMFQSEPVTKEQIKGALNYAIDQLFETK